MMLQATDCSYLSGGRQLLDGVNIQLRPAELLIVLGPNGAGKSTLLKLLTGERSPSTGAVQLDGKNLSSWKLRALAQRRAVMSQSDVLSFSFTVAEVVLLGRAPYAHRSSARRDAQVLSETLEAADVAQFAQRDYQSLSGGERQRVQLARALAQIWDDQDEARYLLLDEPTASLDLAHQHAVLTLAQQLTLRGIGVLAVLHDLNLAARYADRVALLQQGRIVAQGSPAEVMQADLLSEVYSFPLKVVHHAELAIPVIYAA